MTFDTRKMGLYGAIGVLVGALIIAGIVFSGLRLPTFVPNTGTLIIKLTDAPVDLKHLNITIDSVSIHRVEDDVWENLTFVDDVSEVYFDLLALEGITMNLVETEIPAGKYTMIKMHVKTANATYLEDGTVDLNVPSDVIKVIIHFEIESGGIRIVLIDMVPAISESGNLRPVFKAELKATVVS